LKKVISVVLTLLMLISTSSIGYAQHFCGDYLAKATISIGHTHLNCGMEKHEPDCETEDVQAEISRKSCCKNNISKIEIDENYNGSNLEVKLNTTFVAAFIITHINLLFEEDGRSNQFTDYKPPLPDIDVQVLYQTFLI